MLVARWALLRRLAVCLVLAFLSLCLPAASFLTGAIIPVDGGLMARNA